jgi:AMP nucleosidase
VNRPAISGLTAAFERAATPTEAVDRLAALYAQAVAALRAAVERFLVDGTPPSETERACFRYPELRLTYQPDGVPPSNSRAFAKFAEPGVYATTVTQPEEFRAYLLEQLEPLVEEFGATIEVGVGPQEIPYPYVFEDGDELGRGGATAAELARSRCGRAWCGRSRCSTPRASTIRCAGWCTTPAPTGARCSRGCC